MPNTMFLIVTSLAASQLAFMAVAYLLHYRALLLGRLFGLFSLCMISYLLLIMPGISGESAFLVLLFRVGAMLAPAVLWLITRQLFLDNVHTPRWFWPFVGSYIGIRILGHLLYPEGLSTGTASWWLFGMLPQTVMLLLSAHAIHMAIRSAVDDLVEPRRRLRAPFVLIMGLIILIIVLSGYIAPLIDNNVRTIYAGLIFLCVLALNITTFRLHPDASELIFPDQGTTDTADRASAEDDNLALEAHIREALENGNLYADPRLTIGELAQRLSMSEYRLRRFINNQLGYRNFNQFLNRCRVEHAAERLRDRSTLRLPISTIAMEVGYNSLSTFNKAFKEIHGMTPTEYRNGGSETG